MQLRINFFELLRSRQQPLEFSADQDSNLIAPLPPFFGQGRLRQVTVDKDINYLYVAHTNAPQPTLVDTQYSAKILKIGFPIATEPSSTWIDGSSERHSLEQGQFVIASPSSRLQFLDSTRKDFRFFTLDLPPGRIEDLVSDTKEALRPDFERLLREPGGEQSMLVAGLDAQAHVRALIGQILGCPFRGAVQRLYLEGKVLELAAISLQRFLNVEDIGVRSAPFSERDARLMMVAREILDARLSDPPSLPELANELSVSLAKLKRDFKRTHGAAIHEYLVEKRLCLASFLIDEGAVSIKEAAYAVGYRSQSYFTKAYKERFGRLPHQSLGK